MLIDTGKYLINKSFTIKTSPNYRWNVSQHNKIYTKIYNYNDRILKGFSLRSRIRQ